MKTRRVLLGIFITALAVTVILISIRAYYVAIALVIGTLLIGYRELWSLIKMRKLPPFDERIRENISKSVRNGFILLISVIVFLMLPFATTLVAKPDIAVILGSLLLAGGAAYLLSYVYYDRVAPKLCRRRLKMLRVFLIATGISAALFILSVFLHNVLSALFGLEEPVFFTLAVIVAPLGFIVGIVGSLVVFIQGLFTVTS
jgi:hypothetical protein